MHEQTQQKVCKEIPEKKYLVERIHTDADMLDLKYTYIQI